MPLMFHEYLDLCPSFIKKKNVIADNGHRLYGGNIFCGGSLVVANNLGTFASVFRGESFVQIKNRCSYIR